MSDYRPTIGITVARTEATWGVWNQAAAVLPFAYITAVQRAGGTALLIPPDPAMAQEPDVILERLDALILSGGHDIDPGAYSAEAHPSTKGTVPDRDQTEIGLARRAVELDMPVLGICRGMQLLNVAFGGTLHQHLPELYGHEEHRRVPGSFVGSDHDVTLDSGSLAAQAAGETVHVTKSHHHQGVDRIGEGLTVTGHSTLDELAEAIENPGCRFVLGVQWHPEADESSPLIAALVEQARDYRTVRGSA
jgi:putative glutamine amidotransferase